MVYREFLPENCTVNKEFYLKAIHQICGETIYGICNTTMPLPTYAFLFVIFLPKVTTVFTEDLPQLRRKRLRAISKIDYQKSYKHWKMSRHRCIISERLLWRGQISLIMFLVNACFNLTNVIWPINMWTDAAKIYFTKFIAQNF